ncbi:MAG TPA: hypothetical protein VNR39_12390 [Pseudolabrys sp.]|nr:hypothetical protein [Pseudolabrys sp.]
MALKPCRECGANVSTSAEICPHCGVRAPASSDVLGALGRETPPNNRGTRGYGQAAAILALIAIAFAVLAGRNDDKPGTSSNSQGDGRATAATGCRVDWRQCADNSDMANNFNGWVDVKVQCQRQADDRAKYGSPKWPWLAFSSFLGGSDYVKTGQVTAIEPDAQFQNGFGAWVRSRVVCRYDLNAGKVTDVFIMER